MNNKKQLLYIMIGVLSGVVILLGVMFLICVGKVRKLEAQVEAMGKTAEEVVLLAKAEEDTVKEEAEPEEAEEQEKQVEQEKQEEQDKKPVETPAETPTEAPEEDLDASTEFDDLKPQIENLIPGYQSQMGGEWSIYAEDLDTGGSMTINDKKMRAASLIKLYIMGAVYENYDELTAANGSLEGLLGSMITVSDNDAANTLVRYLGGGDTAAGMMKVNAFCQQYGYDNTSMGRLLLEQNPSGENYTSVADCGKFLYHVYNGKFSHSAEMLTYLKGQQRRSKIPAGIPDGIEVANKTGELTDVQNDVAIVFGNTPCIICVMTEGVSGESGPHGAIAEIAAAVYGYLNQTE